MTRDLIRLERLARALQQAQRAAERDQADAVRQLTLLAEQQSDMQLALDRQSIFADLLLGPTLERLARTGLAIAADEARLAELRSQVRAWSIKHRLVMQRLAVARRLEERRQMERDLGENLSRLIGARRASLPQGG